MLSGVGSRRLSGRSLSDFFDTGGVMVRRRFTARPRSNFCLVQTVELGTMIAQEQRAARAIKFPLEPRFVLPYDRRDDR